MKEKTRKVVQKTIRATSYALILKGAVGGSVAALALFGIAVPWIAPFFGVASHPTPFSGGVVATIGAIAGVVAAAKA